MGRGCRDLKRYKRLHIAVGLFWAAPAMGWAADFDLGLDYFAGKTQVFDLQGNRDEFDQSGLGYSLGMGFDNGLGLRVSSSSLDGNQASSLPVGTVALDVAQLARLDSTSFSLSWQWSHYWLGARYRQQDELSRIEGIRTGRRDSVLSLDVQENSESSSFSIEAGRDWFVGNWAPSLGVSLATTEGDFSRVERVDSFSASQVQTFVPNKTWNGLEDHQVEMMGCGLVRFCITACGSRCAWR